MLIFNRPRNKFTLVRESLSLTRNLRAGRLVKLYMFVEAEESSHCQCGSYQQDASELTRRGAMKAGNAISVMRVAVLPLTPPIPLHSTTAGKCA